jgi:hypothetical protein
MYHGRRGKATSDVYGKIISLQIRGGESCNGQGTIGPCLVGNLIAFFARVCYFPRWYFLISVKRQETACEICAAHYGTEQ